MRTAWFCTWSLVPGDGRHVEKYPSEREAKTAMAQLIAKHFDLKPYLDRMRKEKDPDYQEAADYLEQFLSGLMFSECTRETLPHLSGRVESEGYEEDFFWSYNDQYCPCLSARESALDNEPGLFVGCSFQKVPKSNTTQARIINIHIVERESYDSSANPLLVWKALHETPQTQTQLSNRIGERWNTSIERKAVGRHLKLLRTLGYPVRCSTKGYWIEGEFGDPEPGAHYTPSAHPLLILQVLDDTPKTKAAIIRAVQEKFGKKIGHKAVSSHLKLLSDMDFRIRECDGGYTIDG